MMSLKLHHVQPAHAAYPIFKYPALSQLKKPMQSQTRAIGQHNSNPTTPFIAPLALFALSALQVDPALAAIHMEPDNALSIPTWAVHTSSVFEWMLGMALVWKYSEVTGNESIKWLTWGMLPSLAAAMCACTWHFFYNSQELEFLVSLQAFLTVIGNCTCWWAAYKIYDANLVKKDA